LNKAVDTSFGSPDPAKRAPVSFNLDLNFTKHHGK
jgi:hypothetical protein